MSKPEQIKCPSCGNKATRWASSEEASPYCEPCCLYECKYCDKRIWGHVADIETRISYCLYDTTSFSIPDRRK